MSEEEEDVIRGKSTEDNYNRIVTGHVYKYDDDAVKEEEEKEEAFKKNAVPTAGKKMNDRKNEKTNDDATFSFSETHRSLAEKKAYKWAKVKGSPFWPCQVVDVEKFKENVPEFVREKVLRGGGGGGGEVDEDEAKWNMQRGALCCSLPGCDKAEAADPGTGRQTKMSVCANCRQAQYCSREHCVEHFAAHKEACRAAMEARRRGRAEEGKRGE